MQSLISSVLRWMKRERLALLLISLVTIVSYSNIFSNQYVWDDGYFVDWKGYQPGTVDWSGIFAGKVPMAYGEVYRPLRGIWYVISIAATHKNIALLHTQGVIAHFLICVMIYWLVREIWVKGGRGGALTTALLFAAHPIHTEAVSWITASFDTIGIGFMFASLIGWIKSVECRVLSVKSEAKWKYASLILAGFAFFTYELTFVLLPLLILIKWAMGERREKWVSREIKIMGGMILFYFVAKSLLLPPDANQLPWLFGGFWQAILFVPVLLWSYTRSMLVPVFQSTNHLIFPGVSNLYYADNAGHYPKLTLSLLSSGYLGALGGLGALGSLVYVWGRPTSSSKAGLRGVNIIQFAGLWTVISLLPVLQLVPLNSVFAERYAYIASFGVCLLGAIGLERVRRAIGGRWEVGVIGILMILTLQRNRVWATTITLWEDAVKTGPPSAYAFRNLGASYFIYKDYNRAISYYLKAEAVAPTNLETYQKLVYLYGLVGNQVEAQKQMNLGEKLWRK